jgi:2',3'-cyclic-nucleotide 2'-phosphodiesterase (5'-nucleotidase family)
LLRGFLSTFPLSRAHTHTHTHAQNSDFDFGVDTLVKYSNQCKFPWLMSNVNLAATHQPLACGLKTHILTWNDIKIGTSAPIDVH